MRAWSKMDGDSDNRWSGFIELPTIGGFGRAVDRLGFGRDLDAYYYRVGTVATLIDDSHSMLKRLEGAEIHRKSFGGQAVQYKEVGRVRDWFPETLFWRPQIITDERGRAEIRVPLADSITTWRLTASANTLDGRLASATAGLKVFQDFFADIDFPVFLTQNDTVKVPVSLSNYLKEKQRVKVEIAREPWFELLDEPTRELELAPEQVTVAYFRVRVKEPGRHKLLVKAFGTKMSDAVRREVEVVPDGKRFETVINDRLQGRARHTIEIPASSIDRKILFKLYPSTFAQVLDGLDGMLQMPYG